MKCQSAEIDRCKISGNVSLWTKSLFKCYDTDEFFFLEWQEAKLSDNQFFTLTSDVTGGFDANHLSFKFHLEKPRCNAAAQKRLSWALAWAALRLPQKRMRLRKLHVTATLSQDTTTNYHVRMKKSGTQLTTARPQGKQTGSNDQRRQFVPNADGCEAPHLKYTSHGHFHKSARQEDRTMYQKERKTEIQAVLDELTAADVPTDFTSAILNAQ